MFQKSLKLCFCLDKFGCNYSARNLLRTKYFPRYVRLLSTNSNSIQIENKSKIVDSECKRLEIIDSENSFDLSDDFSIVSARKERYLSYTQKSVIEQALEKRLKCSSAKAKEILEEYPALRQLSLSSILQVIKYLTEQKVKLQSIIENGWLLTHTPKHIKIKFPQIVAMLPRNINDFVPLLKATAPRLNQVRKWTKAERNLIPGGHRIYFFSDTMKVDPKIISKYLAVRLFIFSIPFENVEIILNVMIKYNISAQSILRDLWAFRYSPQVVEERLQRAKLGHKNKLMPWMVRCIEPVLARSIQNTLEEKALLGENDFVDYISKRLGFDKETTTYILQKHIAVYNVRVIKIKAIIDYLLNEAGFLPIDIARNPRILCHSLQTTKDRINELKSYGCKPSSLVIVCKSKNEYGKFLSNWISVRDNLKSKDIIQSDNVKDGN